MYPNIMYIKMRNKAIYLKKNRTAYNLEWREYLTILVRLEMVWLGAIYEPVWTHVGNIYVLKVS